ncbi:MAG: hypothetical protein E6G05_11360 [Actinobacteria bacterium]|nr:MAG: hypothetical protein E6G05_11360 [Actinomycetota bacterium]
MPTKLLSLYLRVGTGAVRLAFKLTERAAVLAGSAIGLTGRDGSAARAEPGAEARAAESEAAESEAAEPEAAEPEAAEPGAVAARASAAPRAPVVNQVAVDYEAEPATPLVPGEEVAKTLDDEPELIEELAEPGAEDGAGAEVEVDEPWEGYAEMNAEAVLARIREAGVAELALVELYERANKRRKTVLAAAERRHKEISGPGAR